MQLKDLCKPNKPIETISYRCYGPEPYCEDMLFGYCRWTGKELKSLDSDIYSLDDEIIKYEQVNEKLLVVYFDAHWIKGDDICDNN